MAMFQSPIKYIQKNASKTPKVIFCLFTCAAIIALSTLEIMKPQEPDQTELIHGNSSCPNTYSLSNKVNVNVCLDQDKVFVDIRQFLNSKATIKGIALTKSEYISLGRFYDSIYFDLENLS